MVILLFGNYLNCVCVCVCVCVCACTHACVLVYVYSCETGKSSFSLSYFALQAGYLQSGTFY